jgi:hypothetical protein
MPPQVPNSQQPSRHRVIEVMTRAQEDAMHQLRRDGVSEGLALAVMQRISSLCLHTLRELDGVYREFEGQLAQDPDRSKAHQEWLDTKAGGLLLSLEALIAAVVAEAMNNAKAAYHDHITQPRETVTPPPRPARRARGEYPVWLLLVWMTGIASSTLFAWQASASIIWAGVGLLVPLLLWVKLGKSGWGLVFPLTGIGMEAWAVLWHLIVEGGF